MRDGIRHVTDKVECSHTDGPLSIHVVADEWDTVIGCTNVTRK